jgi:hypothetical protein
MEVYLGVKGKRLTSFSAKGEKLTFLRNHFSGLTPKLLAQVRPFAEKNIADKIHIPEAIVKVPTTMLGTELRKISYDSPILLGNKGKEFNLLSPDPKTVGDVVDVMKQIFLHRSNPYTLTGSKGILTGGTGILCAEVDKNVVSKRGVTVWLDQISGGEYNNAVGLFMSLNRFFGSVTDYAEVVIPLGLNVIDDYIPKK